MDFPSFEQSRQVYAQVANTSPPWQLELMYYTHQRQRRSEIESIIASLTREHSKPGVVLVYAHFIPEKPLHLVKRMLLDHLLKDITKHWLLLSDGDFDVAWTWLTSIELVETIHTDPDCQRERLRKLGVREPKASKKKESGNKHKRDDDDDDEEDGKQVGQDGDDEPEREPVERPKKKQKVDVTGNSKPDLSSTSKAPRHGLRPTQSAITWASGALKAANQAREHIANVLVHFPKLCGRPLRAVVNVIQVQERRNTRDNVVDHLAPIPAAFMPVVITGGSFDSKTITIRFCSGKRGWSGKLDTAARMCYKGTMLSLKGTMLPQSPVGFFMEAKTPQAYLDTLFLPASSASSSALPADDADMAPSNVFNADVLGARRIELKMDQLQQQAVWRFKQRFGPDNIYQLEVKLWEGEIISQAKLVRAISSVFSDYNIAHILLTYLDPMDPMYTVPRSHCSTWTDASQVPTTVLAVQECSYLGLNHRLPARVLS